ncbi:MAG TPA: FKBP-type peptidyl-prolyl cis-trans isomerase [Longimicrobiales bacterium]|nr:FKBP-type peptidyl-prolyl cis-trans isomerase [Longimicrobiales bacterium]
MNTRIHAGFGRLATLLLAALAASACGSDPAGPDFDASLGIDLASMVHTPSGLYYKDLVVGAGATVAVGDSATVAYSGWLANGTPFDAGTYPFTVGVGRVVPGFDEGVLGMKVGGKRKLVIPPDLGYGNQNYGPIPGNSTLVFEVELRDILTTAPAATSASTLLDDSLVPGA